MNVQEAVRVLAVYTDAMASKAGRDALNVLAEFSDKGAAKPLCSCSGAAEREARVWTALEKWIEAGPFAEIREIQIRKPRRANQKWAVVVDARDSLIHVDGSRTFTVKSKSFRGTTRIEALENAAYYCAVHS